MDVGDLAVVVAASVLGAFVKAVTGMGYPLLAVPLISLRLGIEDAAVIVAAPNVTANFLLCRHARASRAEARDLGRLLAWSMAGALVGTYLLVSIPEEPLLVLLAATIAAFVVNYLRTPDFAIAPRTGRRWSPTVGAAAGVMQGAVGVSGPVVAAWVHGYRLSKDAYVFTVTAIFGVSGAVQLVLLAASGTVTASRAAASALAFLPVLAMLPVGTRLRSRLGGRGFEYAVLAVLVVAGVALVGRIAA